MKITKKHLQQVIKEEIRNLVREQQETGIILIQLSTPWCGPCKALKKKFEQHNAPTDKWIYINVDPNSIEEKDFDLIEKHAGALMKAGYLTPKKIVVDGVERTQCRLPECLSVDSIPVLLKVNFDAMEIEVVDHSSLLNGTDIEFVKFLESNGLLNPAMRDGIVSPDMGLGAPERPKPSEAQPAKPTKPTGKFSPSEQFL